MAQERVNLHFHYDEGVWWADSPDLKLSAGDSDLEEAKSLARGAVRLALGPDVVIVEWMDPPEQLVPFISVAASHGERVSVSSEPGHWPEAPQPFDFSIPEPTEPVG